MAEDVSAALASAANAIMASEAWVTRWERCAVVTFWTPTAKTPGSGVGPIPHVLGPTVVVPPSVLEGLIKLLSEVHAANTMLDGD